MFSHKDTVHKEHRNADPLPGKEVFGFAQFDQLQMHELNIIISIVNVAIFSIEIFCFFAFV
jgi:hypothetical protein